MNTFDELLKNTNYITNIQYVSMGESHKNTSRSHFAEKNKII